MKKFILCKLCLIGFGAVQSVIGQTTGSLLNIEFQCVEVDRISISPKGQMQPAYPGRTVNVKIGENSVTANGVFFAILTESIS